MDAHFIAPQYLVWTAGVFFTLGYLVINQKILRVLLLIGTGFYLWYYFVAADRPLWEAILTSSVMGTANLIGLSGLLLRESKLIVPRAHRDIYKRFKDLPPGDFRELVGQARRYTLTEEEVITREGVAVDKLYFVVSGKLQVEKRGERFLMPAGVFVGEVAYLTGMRSSATTRLPAGAEVLVWDVARLRRRAKRRPRFSMALNAMISKDLAIKVALAVAPHQVDNTREAEAMQDEVRKTALG
ncbi:cyclic nucleotide-binding domain-containing protein [Tropicibacter naphthalenivorans]|uniref:Cyclic nucleotide-binding domain protein n=1 Tax=Tropicibacter naphthalenivorans TaxID=441103 RepID=A0A0P1G2T1_9RHOB|nr:cyclic nucleotide-binding domain-containing protein [Tropicibacter naphthalenivorans]CUH76138.1 Cyclic nucleotide-binding domain protein [Tropicibacter naphthalenivorans]SMC39725.1 Popeye protein conserved region [Tropicibacter naphthalenivorans]